MQRLLALLVFALFASAGTVLVVGGRKFDDSATFGFGYSNQAEKEASNEALVCETILDCFGGAVKTMFGWTKDNIKEEIRKIPRGLHYVHMFCGGGTFDTACHDENLWGIGYDRCVNPVMNFSTIEGVGVAVLLALMIKVNGKFGGGPECKSWLWLTLSLTKRTQKNLEGNTNEGIVFLT